VLILHDFFYSLALIQILTNFISLGLDVIAGLILADVVCFLCKLLLECSQIFFVKSNYLCKYLDWL